jgi:sarcosine oxidase/L-pipecolate oxidase
LEYQTLAIDAISQWKRWNAELESGKTLPPGFTRSDRLFVNNGVLTMNSDTSLTQFEMDSMRNMSISGFPGTQIDLTNLSDVDNAKANGFEFAVNPFHRLKNYGQLDMTGGFVYADKACYFALHKAETLGVKPVLGGSKGTFLTLLRDQSSRVVGVKTADGVSHPAELTIMACGGWTPSLVPDLDNLCETTCGSVSIFQLPLGSQLWERFAPQNYPTWM